MTSTADKIATLWPEIVLLMGAVSCLVTGLHRSSTARRWTPAVAAISLAVALVLSLALDPGGQAMGFDGLTTWVRVLGYGLGLALLGVSVGLPDRVESHAMEPALGADDTGFNPARSVKGEYYAFFLFSLSGLGMVAAAGDLVWLFLALELVSLPTYVMIATARPTARSHEAAIKYFFLGALSVAVFLYGFALLYGATGFTDLEAIRLSVVGTGPTPLMLAGLALAVVGLCYKTACFPMHGYAADVYEGAPTAVTAFLAVVPKVAGFVALVLVLGTVGWPLPVPLVVLLSVIAIVTMTLGNVLALVQTKLKRVMAYSSVAHSGYLMLGLIAGPAVVGGVLGGETLLNPTRGDDGILSVAGAGNGLAGLLFYLLSYALATITAIAIIGLLRTPGDADADPASEAAESSPGYADLQGLRHRHPVLGLALLLSMLSLMGVPPLIGFVGKLVLALPVLELGLWPLVVALVLNSAISAVYYLRIAVAGLGGGARRSDEAGAADAGPLAYAPFRGGVAIAGAVAVLVGGTFPAAWAFGSADRAFDTRARAQPAASAAAGAPVAVEPAGRGEAGL